VDPPNPCPPNLTSRIVDHTLPIKQVKGVDTAMQGQHPWNCSGCGFAAVYNWELREHLKTPCHKRGRFLMPFSRWVIRHWVRASTGRKIIASIMLAIYVVLLVMFLDNFELITLVIGLLIAFTLRVKLDASDGEY
jgi:hypothetical protein